ncbi:MAG: hypothetical protein K2P16_07305 [Lawsonibacter sp.]|nr:hypothetical protein [Lawsonibacter sp.]
MSTPLSFCDISARYGQMPAPQKSVEEQTGWNPNQLFKDYLMKLQRLREQEEEHAREDALMAMIDAMNAPERDRQSDQDTVAARSLAKAGAAVYKSEKFQDVRATFDGEVNINVMPEIRALLALLGSADTLRQVDDIQEEQEEQRELSEKRESLEVTEQRDPGNPSDPEEI